MTILPMIIEILFLIAVYVLGGIPSGLLLAKLLGVQDPRTAGSGNIGATNMLRVGGKKLALLTLLCDALKGVVAVYAARMFFPELFQLAGLVVIVGHIFSIWLRFKGGKGIATSLGVLLAWSWPLALMALAAWVVVFVLSRLSSLAALVATGLTPLFAYFLYGEELVLSCLLMAIFILFSHKSNIKRLISGSEAKIDGTSKKDQGTNHPQA
jgi:glycerol-3-phosphate acyltransferase PlsY